MRYDAFRNSLLLALSEAELYSSWDRPTETIDLATTTGSWKTGVGSGLEQRAEPFLLHGSMGPWVHGIVSFRWDPLESARTQTTEEDLVSELFGRDDDLPETMQRELRTDIVLRANLPYASRTPMPEPSLWRSWSALVDDRLAPFLPAEVVQHRGQTVIVMGWRGTVEVESRCSDDGELCLSSVSLPSWQAVVLPRIRDGADDELEGDIAKQLDDLAEGHRIALDQWMDCIAELR